MIYDCFSFFNELDLLEIRLNTLKDVVDRFVLVESTLTHTGKPKPLYYAENKSRFADFNDRITHIVVDDFPLVRPDTSEREQAWVRENTQRNAIVRGLKDAKPDDILIIADLDEIPNPDVVLDVAKTITTEKRVNLFLRSYAYYLNFFNASEPEWPCGPQLLTWRCFNSPATYEGATYYETVLSYANAEIPAASLIRALPRVNVTRNAGWHFTSVGGITAIQKKLQSFAHTEYELIGNDPEAIEKRIRSGKGLFGDDCFFAEPTNLYLPKYIQENQGRFKNLIIQTTIEDWEKQTKERDEAANAKSDHGIFIDLMIAITPKFLHPLCSRIRRRIQLASWKRQTP